MGALTVLYLVLPFPLAFILHDAEEVLTQHKWMLTHADTLKAKFPRLKSIINHLAKLNTQAFAIAAFEELIVILAATAYLLTGGPLSKEIWMALFLAFSVHILVHLLQGIIIHKYVPGLITSIVLLPYLYMGIHIIHNALSSAELALYTLLGIIIMVVNLRFVHWLGNKLASRRTQTK